MTEPPSNLRALGRLGASIGAWSGRYVALRTDEAEASMRFATLITAYPIALAGRLFDEVERRTALHAELWPQTPTRHTCTARAAALRSVTEDIISGRLP